MIKCPQSNASAQRSRRARYVGGGLRQSDHWATKFVGSEFHGTWSGRSFICGGIDLVRSSSVALDLISSQNCRASKAVKRRSTSSVIMCSSRGATRGTAGIMYWTARVSYVKGIRGASAHENSGAKKNPGSRRRTQMDHNPALPD